MLLRKLTDHKWINLFNVSYRNKKGNWASWIFASRNNEDDILYENRKVDAVVIVPFIKKNGSYSLIVTKEFRPPLDDYEVGLPAGLINNDESPERTAIRELKEETGLDVVNFWHISPPVYSSAGMTDESVVFVFVECRGEISTEKNEETEDIEVFVCDEIMISWLMEEKISAKLYPILIMARFLGINALAKCLQQV